MEFSAFLVHKMEMSLLLKESQDWSPNVKLYSDIVQDKVYSVLKEGNILMVKILNQNSEMVCSPNIVTCLSSASLKICMVLQQISISHYWFPKFPRNCKCDHVIQVLTFRLEFQCDWMPIGYNVNRLFLALQVFGFCVYLWFCDFPSRHYMSFRNNW